MVRGVLKWSFISAVQGAILRWLEVSQDSHFPVQGAILRWLDMPSLYYESYLWGPHHPFHGPQCACTLCYSLSLRKVFMLCNKMSFIYSLSFHLAKYYRILVYIMYYFTYFIVDNTKYEEYWSSFKSVFITCLNSATFPIFP